MYYFAMMMKTYSDRITVDILIINPSPSDLNIIMFLILSILVLFACFISIYLKIKLIMSYSITMMIEIYSDKNTYVDIHINPSPSELLRQKIYIVHVFAY